MAPGDDEQFDEEDIYQEHILDHFEDPYHRGSCEHATHAHEDDNPLCGDVVHVELRIGPEGKVQEAWFDGEGCCISQASASMLMERIEGKSVEEVKKFGAPEMLRLFGARLTPNRQKCCLLPWRVVQTALHSPVGDNGGGTFAGPDLGEEA
jgi:nitrogen fixation protein NifU and related proteins